MKKLTYQTFREGYGPDQVRRTMTVEELISFLSDFDGDTPVYLSFDNGYTYGGITADRFEDDSEEEEVPCSGNCQSCPYLAFEHGFPGETLTCCTAPGKEHIIDNDFDVSAVI